MALAACSVRGPVKPLGQSGTANHKGTVLADGFLLTAASQEGSAGAPIALTGSDGNPLRLTSVDAKSVVQGPLVFTELHLSFDNPQDRTIEGRFRIALPPGASLSRFAMRIGEHWQEGEVVERKNAQRIYEDFLHRRIDPALLEQGAGNAFTARVFPIAAKSKKQLVLSYSQALGRDRRNIVPLRGLPQLDKLEVQLTSASNNTSLQQFSKAHYTPDADFSLDRASLGAAGLRNSNLALARITVPASPGGQTRQPVSKALLLVDSSASRALELNEQIALVKMMARKMATSPNSQLAVACFDQVRELIFQGTPGDFGAKHVERMRRRRALGGSDLRGALRWAGQQAATHKLERIILLSDGVATIGEDGKALLRTAAGLKSGGVKRLDAIAFGGIRDEDGLRSVVTAGLDRHGVVVDATLQHAALWRRLSTATRSKVKVEVAGARWWSPRSLEGAQVGDEVLLHVEIAANKQLQVSVDGRQVDGLRIEQTARPLLERSWARAKIDSLLERERREGKSATLRKEIVALSKRHRVLSPYTGLLVLETQRDYDRYQLSRDALADILTVQGGRLQVLQRSVPVPAAKPRTRPLRGPRMANGNPTRGSWGRPPPSTDPLSASGNMWGDEIGDSFGAGGLALSGIGEGGGGRGEGIGLGKLGTVGRGAGSGTGQGFGSGHGRLGRSHRARRPAVRMSGTTVSGRLPPEIIRRIVRQQIGRIRACYQQALNRSPQLSGRLVTRFVIGRDGKVSNAGVTGSLGNAAVSRCVVRAISAMTFPRPAGGIVTVSYPFVFSPNNSAPSRPGASGSAVASVAPAPTSIAPLPAARPQTPSPPAPDAPKAANPYRGQLASIMRAIAEGRATHALEDAQAWQAKAPGDVLALTALGQALQAVGKPSWAARAYGSIIDLFPSRVDLRRYAGGRLEALSHKAAQRIALDTYAKAAKLRPDHPSGHRLYAFALLRQGQYGKAYDALVAGLKKGSRGRSAAARSVLLADLGLLGAAWLRAEPSKRQHIINKLAEQNAKIASKPSLRFVLSWETDTNDVDLHVYDAEGGHASYASKSLASGGRLHGDVTNGYGPELFEIVGKKRSRGYRLQAHYYSRGPMGYGMGKVQIVEHDGSGKLSFDERPFVVMVDRAFVDLGSFGDYKRLAKLTQ